MRTTHKKANAKLHKIEFDDYQDILNYLADYDNPNSNAQTYDQPEFCKFSFDQALEMLKSGWPEGVKEVADITETITDKITRDAATTVSYDVTGDFLDVGTYLTGQPECWGLMETIEGPKNEIDIIVNVTYSYSVKQETIYNRGAAITALIDQLQKTHFVNVKFVQRVDDSGSFNGKDFELTFNVNTKNDYSRDLIAFYAANSSFLRRLIFAIEEKYCKRDRCGSYGCIVKPDGIDAKNTVYFKEVTNDSQWNTPETAAAEVKKLIEEYSTQIAC